MITPKVRRLPLKYHLTASAFFIIRPLLCAFFLLAAPAVYAQDPGFSLTMSVQGAKFINDDLSRMEQLYVYQSKGAFQVSFLGGFVMPYGVPDGYVLKDQVVSFSAFEFESARTVPTDAPPDPATLNLRSGDEFASTEFSLNGDNFLLHYIALNMNINVQAVVTYWNPTTLDEFTSTFGQHFDMRLVVFKEIYISTSDSPEDQMFRVDVSKVNLTPDDSALDGAWVTMTPIVGEDVKPTFENGNLHFTPEQATTQLLGDNYTFGSAYFYYSSPGEEFYNAVKSKEKMVSAAADDAVVGQGAVKVEIADGQTTPGGNLTVYFCTIESVLGDVKVRQPLSSEYIEASRGMRLEAGTTIRMANYFDSSNHIRQSFVKLRFYSRMRSEVTMLDEVTHTGALYLMLGQKGVEETRPNDIITDGTNLAYKVAENPRYYAKMAVYTGIGTLAGLVSGLTWRISTPVNYGISKIEEWVSGKSSAYARRSPLLQNSTQTFADQAPVSFISRIREDGAVVFENSGVPLTLAGGSSETVIPQGASVVAYNKASHPVSVPNKLSSYTPVALSLTPANGSDVNSLYSCIKFDSPYSPSVRPLPGSLRARLNGVLISDLTFPANLDQDLLNFIWVAQWCPPDNMPLKRTSNILKASLSSTLGERTNAFSFFSAKQANIPAPDGLSAFPGSSTVVLRWNSSKIPGVLGYRVYRATSANSSLTQLGSSLVTNSAFVDENPYAPSGCYAIKAIYSEVESLMTERACVRLLPAPAGVLPSKAELFTAEPVNKGVLLKFKEGARLAAAWLLERSTSKLGTYSNVLTQGTYLSGLEYTDSNIALGKAYFYRLTPVGGDLEHGESTTVGPIVASDLAPDAPIGLTAELSNTLVSVEWNPSLVSDIKGYNIYRAAIGEQYVKRNAGLLLTNSWAEMAEPDRVFYWKVTAVDTAGNESAWSRSVSLSSFGLSSDLVPPVYALWNGFLGMTNVLELVNKGDSGVIVTVSLFDIMGNLAGKKSVSLSLKQQFDLIINDFPGFQANSYGIISLDYYGQVTGRVSFYRSAAQSSSYEFAFAVPFGESLRGKSAVGFNTFQPSLDPVELADPVLQWLSIVNLDQMNSRSFSVHRYNESGSDLGQTKIVVPPFSRVDLEAGHINPGPSRVGMHTIEPADSTAPYLAQIARYGSRASGGDNYAFAFPLIAKPGTSKAQWAPISNGANAQNWLEVLNLADRTATVNATLFDNSGATLLDTTFTLPSHGQKHLNASGVLSYGQTGAARVQALTPGSPITAQSMFYFYNGAGGIAAMYGSQSKIPIVGQKTGSYNLFLGMYNWLRVFNASDAVETVLVQIYGAGGTPHSLSLLMQPHTGADFGLHENATFGTTSDSYGVVTVNGPALSEILRIHPDEMGEIDFAAPTSVE